MVAEHELELKRQEGLHEQNVSEPNGNITYIYECEQPGILNDCAELSNTDGEANKCH